MRTLTDQLRAVEARRKTLDVYTDSEPIVADLQAQFSTRNVDVVHRPFQAAGDREFVTVRDGSGRFLRSLALTHLRELLSPAVASLSAFAEAAAGEERAPVFDFLENTVFASFDRRQMLAVTREIEDRAYRIGSGRLSVGFQNPTTFTTQRDRYRQFADDTAVSVRLFVDDDQGFDPGADLGVITDGADEIGRFWFLVFEADEPGYASALVAEERAPGEFYGFWTYDDETVAELLSYLDSIAGDQ